MSHHESHDASVSYGNRDYFGSLNASEQQVQALSAMDDHQPLTVGHDGPGAEAQLLPPKRPRRVSAGNILAGMRFGAAGRYVVMREINSTLRGFDTPVPRHTSYK